MATWLLHKVYGTPNLMKVGDGFVERGGEFVHSIPEMGKAAWKKINNSSLLATIDPGIAKKSGGSIEEGRKCDKFC
jgi:hypothetical protein